MQPKCSQSSTNNSSILQSSSSTISAPAQQFLLVPVERFKEICLRSAAAVASGTSNSTISNEINSVLDYFFDPEKDIYKFLSDFDIFKLYLTGGIGIDSFKNKVKSFDNSSVCGLVWNVNYVAYRCRTCALSPCMSICAECFRNGDHKGHDFNMFRSGAGGACDCGDECVMNSKGFCKSHGCHSSKSSQSALNPPDELIACCEQLLPNLLYRLIQYFRNVFSSNDFNLVSRSQTNLMLNDIQIYLEFLNELCSSGTPVRKILVDYMISQEFYEKKIQYEIKKQSTIAISAASIEENNSDQTEKGKTNYKQEVYLKALNQQKKIQVPKKFESIAEQICNLSSKTMLDEFLFWCIKFEFPEAIVKYLLSLLPDIRYKQVFIKSFVSQYSYISILLLNSKSEHLESRSAISVQLFSNEAIAMKALEESHLLPIILSTLYNMIVTPYNHQDEDKLLIACKSENELNNKHKVIDPDHSIMQEDLYSLIISDLVNLLSHKAVAMVLLQNENLVEIWFELISYFQVMNLNVRKFGEHVQQEQPTYFSSFSAELEFCSSVLWSFLQHLKGNQNANLSKKLINLLMINLRKWLTSIDLVSSYSLIKRPNSKHLTFHLPLHRYFSAFIYNAIYEQSCDLNYLLGVNECRSHFLADILAYPLQLQIGLHEIDANMWVRNGMQMKGQAMTYVQHHFCTSFSDSDLFLIQVLASRIEPSVFMEMFFERFHLIKWMEATTKNRHKNHLNTLSSSQQSVTNISSQSSETIVASVVEEMLDEFENSTTAQTTASASNLLNEQEEQDYLSDQAHQVAMLVGSLAVLAQIITIKPNLSFKSYSLTRTEVVNLLCVLDRTYSQIDDSMPDIFSLSQAKRFIPNILNDVADFLQPSLDISSIGNLKQGRYKPKDSIWLTEYDPLYTMLSSVKGREFQGGFDRYSQFIEKKFTNKKVPKNLWPPFRLPQLVENIEELNNQLHNQMMEQEAEDQETNASSFLNYTNKERLSQLRLDYELRFKSKILNTKSLHAILITILHEHFYTNSMAEKVVYFAVYILELALHFSSSNAHSTETESATSKFDEFNYETWFKSNEIKRNLCTFVPFVSSKLVPIEQQTTNISVEEGQSFKAPPQKRICSRSALHSNEQGEQGEEGQDLDETDESKTDYLLNTFTGPTNEKFKLQKTKTYESILSLLVKIYHRNKSTAAANDDDDNTKSNQLVRLDFLSSKSQHHSKSTDQSHDTFQFETNRIGNENDFIYNLLEKAANSCEKCRLNIEKSLEALNKSSSSDKSAQINSTTSTQQSTSSSNNEQQQQQLQQTTVDSEILKNKKLKAKQRQQRILAQMSNSQQAFLLNPINRLDVEAFKETKSISESSLATEETSATSATTTTVAATTSSSIETIKKLDDEYEEEFECCICRLPATSANGQTTDRPLGAVTLLQSTSILGHRESIHDKHNYIKHSLPLSDDINYKQLQTDTMCWKKEETRVKILREAFSIDSCKYSINIGWKGGVYAQMCGHYLHFDCYNSYKKTLDEHLTRTSNHEYSCPLCRQIANCVLPIITLSSAFNTNKQHPIQPSHSQALTSLTPPFSLAHSSLANTPAKLWILSSLADKQNQLEQIFSNDNDHMDSSTSVTNNSKLSPNDSDSLNKHILNLLKTRPYSTPEFSSKTLTQCKNDALAIITLTTPLEFRYIDQFTSTGLAVGSSNTSPIDDDIAMFTSSVLRTQLEIDLMLKQITDDPFTVTNLKKRRSCFLPLYDVISTHCRLMCHELKPHVKLWLMLTNPVLLAEEISNQFIKIKIRQFEQSDSNKSSSLSSNSNAAASASAITAESHKQAVPILLKDPIACLLLVLVNLPTNVNRAIFNSVVQSLFNMVFVQNLIYLCREFDQHERDNWSTTTTTTTTTTATLAGTGNGTRWLNFKDYVANVINSLKKTNIFLVSPKANSSGVTSSIDHFVHTTIWSLESAKNYVKTKCLHFLKIASLLQFYFYDQEIQFNQLNSFDYLIKNLNLIYNDDNGSGGLLHWSLGNPSEIISVWIDELITSNDQHHQQIESLYSINFDEYHFPSLLELPYLYSDLFGYYSAKKCQFCSKIPKETGICLLCGVQFCYKNHYCCDSMKDFNKKHLNFCGAQTLVLLNINSTYVFVIRGKRCAPWASLYLDEHGEEDRDLRRGKPLYLNKQRYNLLKSTWLNHSFDYQSLKWYNASLFIY